MVAIVVTFDVKPDHVISCGKQTVRPSAESAEKIDRQRFFHGLSPHRSASTYSFTMELIDRFITVPVTVFPMNFP